MNSNEVTWERYDTYTWIRFNVDTGKYDVVSLWETMPQFEGDKYTINVDRHEVFAEANADAFDQTIEEDAQETVSFYTHEEVENHLRDKYQIEVSLPKEESFT